MKTFIGAMLTFFLIILGVQFYIHKTNDACETLATLTDKMTEAAVRKDWNAFGDEFLVFDSQWKSTSRWFSCFIYHKDIDFVEEALKELEIYMRYQDAERAATKTNVLSVFLRKLPENERLTIENIL